MSFRAAAALAPSSVSAAQPPCRYEAYDSSMPILEEKLAEAYDYVLKACFDEIGAPIEQRSTFLTLAQVARVNPDARTHLVMAYQGETPVGATLSLTYGKDNTAFWMYDGVMKSHRGQQVATEMHRHMDREVQQRFQHRPYRNYTEFACKDPVAFFEKLESTGQHEIVMPYRDSLDKPGWTLTVKDVSGSGISRKPEQIDKDELYDILRRNRELALMRLFTPETEKTDPAMAFYRDAMHAVPGDCIPVRSSPLRFRHKAHRNADNGSRSCADSL